MPHEVTFHLHTRPEAWSDQDHADWAAAVAAEDLVPDGSAWRTRATGTDPEVRVRVHADPADGYFAFHVPEAQWRDVPVTVARVLRDLVNALAVRTDCVFGRGPTTDAVPRPHALADVTALDTLVVIGPDFVAEAGWDRVDTLPGFVVEGLAGSAVLLRIPFKTLTAAWSPDREARLLDAEMHLRLKLDPERFPRLHGPARNYRRRLEGSP